jgi:hypothetical protein
MVQGILVPVFYSLFFPFLSFCFVVQSIRLELRRPQSKGGFILQEISSYVPMWHVED